MSNKKSYFGATLKVIFALVLMVWFVGGVLAGLYYNFEAKKQCVENEGWFKGMLWCSTGGASYYAVNVFKGFLWPVSTIASINVESRRDDPIRRAEEQFVKSPTGAVYTCLAVALKSGRDVDSAILANKIVRLHESDEEMRKRHTDYWNFAVKAVRNLEKSNGLDGFYKETCTEQVKKYG